MKSKISTRIVTLLCALFLSISAFAQVTTATLTGIVEDDKGETLIGAAVVAIHEPSGSRYAAVTREDGLFTIPNMRVGGPYSVKKVWYLAPAAARSATTRSHQPKCACTASAHSGARGSFTCGPSAWPMRACMWSVRVSASSIVFS